MATPDLVTALRRTQSVLRRRPSAGLHDDSLAVARWAGGVRAVASHPNGQQILTDMPAELGGGGDQVSPGWLVRAGLAACTTTSIAMAAACKGIELDALEVRAASRSDARGILGMAEPGGAAVYPGPRTIQMIVRISARGVPPERLRALVEEGERQSPMSAVVRDALPLDLHIEVGES